MNYFLFFAGVLIVVFVIVNVFISTLAPRGSRLFTQRILKWIWSFFYWLGNGKGTNKILNYAGLATLVVLLVVWISIFWLGNSLIFMSSDGSIVSTPTNADTNPLEKVYFVGYVMSTLGNGDFKPSGNLWMIYTSIISFSGFIMISIIVSYLISVSSGEIHKRKASGYIHSLGTSPADILLNGWNGKDFSRLSSHFSQLTSLILQVSHQHLTYPVLHNFHSNKPGQSFTVNLACLDEALNMLLLYKPNEMVPVKSEIYSLQFAISEYLASLQKAFIKPAKKNLDLPGNEFFKENGIPFNHTSPESIDLTHLQKRRQLLLGMLQNDGWEMHTLYSDKGLMDYDF